MTACTNCGVDVEAGRGFLIPSKTKRAPALHVCSECADKMDAAVEEETQDPKLPLALLLGLLAAIVAAVAWYAMVVISKYELGILAIGMGWLVATAVMLGAGRKRGRALQALAVVITVLALLFSEYLIVRHFMVQSAAEEGYGGYPILFPPDIMLQFIVIGLKASPVSLLFWALALWNAFFLPAKRTVRKVPI